MKDNNNVSGNGRSTCPFYDELDAILGTRAASSPPVVLESGGGGAEGSPTELEVEEEGNLCDSLCIE